MSAGHTPGPWTATFDDGDWYISCHVGPLCDRIPTIVADIEPMVGSGAAEANARLIAAAPELYEALVLIWREWSLRCDPNADFPDWPDDAMAVMNDAHKNGFAEKARAALAKARGEA